MITLLAAGGVSTGSTLRGEGSTGSCTAFVDESHRLWSRHIAGLDAIDLEASALDHSLDRAVQVTATADPPPCRVQPILPSAHARVRRKAVFDK